MQVNVLLLVVVAGLCFCQGFECPFPTNDDVESVISRIILTGDFPTIPVVNVTRFHAVCLASGQRQDRYRFFSAVVEYTCSGNPNCPSGNVVEQIESECGVDTVLGNTDNIRSTTIEANFTTTTREDCSFCSSPELANVLSVSTDSVTHCVG